MATIIDMKTRERTEVPTVLHALASPVDDLAVESLARLLAANSYLIRYDDPKAFDRLPAAARHGCREIAMAYVKVVRTADGVALDNQAAEAESDGQ